MSAPSRAAQFGKLYRILKRYYSPVAPDPNRPVLEQLLYGCLLENAPYAAADEAYAALVHGFFDWNEIRVTTVRELAEVMPRLPDPPAAANHIKRVLQNVFEATYAFDLEELRKVNLGTAAERLKKIDGATPFAVAYVIQASLGGHSIPIDSGTLRALHVVNLVSQENVNQGVVPGLERAIAKSKGIEFGSLLHQLGADYVADPYSSHLREILVQIDPAAETRLPKRRAKKSPPQAELAVAPPADKPATLLPARPATAPSENLAEHAKSPEKPAERKKRTEPAAATVPAAKGDRSAKQDKPLAEQKAPAKKKPAAAKKKLPEKTSEPPPEQTPDRSSDRPPEKKRDSTSADRPPSETEPPKPRPEAPEISKRKPR